MKKIFLLFIISNISLIPNFFSGVGGSISDEGWADHRSSGSSRHNFKDYELEEKVYDLASDFDIYDNKATKRIEYKYNLLKKLKKKKEKGIEAR